MTHLQLQGFQPDLITLQQALDASDDDDVSAIMPFIIHLDNFAEIDRNTAFTVLRTTFWSEKANNTYQVKPILKLVTAKNLSIIITKIGDKKIERFIFIDHNKEYLSHFPITDLITLLSSHYSDRFANFVFNQFKGFLKAKLSLRIRYLNIISVKAIIEILKNGGVGKSLSNDELIIVTIKMKKYLTLNSHNIDITDNTYLDSQSILPEIIQLIIVNIKSLTTSNIQSIIQNDLIIDIEQSKNIINELLLRQNKHHRLIAILSTDGFACFNNENGSLIGDKQYSVSVEIQNNTNIGSIFIVLLQPIASNYEVVLFVSSNDNSQIKELNIGMNNSNPVVIIPWPLLEIGSALSFRIYCQLRPRNDVNTMQYGLKHMFLSKRDSVQWNMNDTKMVMCIYCKTDGLSWINCMVHDKMTFGDMIDSASAQLGLSPAQYIIRNQMGYKCSINQTVIKHLDEMVMNSNLFPVFILSKSSGDGTQSNPFQF